MGRGTPEDGVTCCVGDCADDKEPPLPAKGGREAFGLPWRFPGHPGILGWTNLHGSDDVSLSGYFWVGLGFLVVAVTKYLMSVRLRGLTDLMHKEQADAQKLRHVLLQAEDKETALKTEAERLQDRVSALRNVVGNLERSLQRFRLS
jgi:hypothetical protein